MRIVIWVSDNCNLNCKYCYLKNKANSYMSINTANHVMSFIANEIVDTNDPVNIQFHGGEPLTNPEIIKYIISFHLSQYRSHNI